MFRIFLCLWGILFYSFSSQEMSANESVTVEFSEDSDIWEITEDACLGRPAYCKNLLYGSLELEMSKLYGKPLSSWKWSEPCGCMMPQNRTKLKHIQHMHVPKAGSSINWFFRDYFDCDDQVEDVPCPIALEQVDAASLLCGGKLLSCAGHRVSPDTSSLIISGMTSAFVMLRHPWARLQSDFYYSKNNPLSSHLTPEFNTLAAMDECSTPFQYSQYPGTANCATKMMNGYQCGELVNVTFNHLATAKEVLLAMVSFGITEAFSESVCMFSWLYGGIPHDRHFRKYRTGQYVRQSLEEALTPAQQRLFNESEKYDLQLYDFAAEVFAERREAMSCAGHT